jgi:integrase
MAVEDYKGRSGRTYWKIDVVVVFPDGRRERIRERNIPTKGQAEARERKLLSDAYEGRAFDKVTDSTTTVQELWNLYSPITQRDNDSWLTDKGRAAHLTRHLGDMVAAKLTQEHVDEYRQARLTEKTCRGSPPSLTTLDREVELLKRIINYGVRCKRLPGNPLSGVALLNPPNVRETVLNEDDFTTFVAHADEWLRPILLVGFDTGMRKKEVLLLRKDQIDWESGAIRLSPHDTKTNKGRLVYLTTRALAALKALPNVEENAYLFVNPKTKRPWTYTQHALERARKASGLAGVWIHDLRRSFVTNARRAGVSESVVMKLSGHNTNQVFKRYNIVEDEDLKAAAKRINVAKGGSPVPSDKGSPSTPPRSPAETVPKAVPS